MYGGLLGPSWSSFGASWDRSWSIFPPGGRGRGGSRRSFLKLFLDVLAERQKKDNLANMLMFFRTFFYAMFCPLLPSLLHGRRRRTNAKMLKIHWFLWVASHMRLFSGSARSNQISEGTRSKKRLNISSKMRTQGTNIDVQKKHFLRPKWLPKWTPEAS